MVIGDNFGSGSQFFSKLAEERGKIAKSHGLGLGVPQSRTCMCLTKNSLSEKPNVRFD